MISLSEIMVIKNGVKVFNFDNTVQYLIYHGKKKYGDHFMIYPVDYETIYKLLAWRIQDEKNCQKYDLDPKKGILLSGPVGCGKTTIMSLLSYASTDEEKYPVKSCREIAIEFAGRGYDTVNKYTRKSRIATPVCLDDIGEESEMTYFGTKVNVIGDILKGRYSLFTNYKIKTHGTTNLNAVEFEEKYGERVRSRMRSLFNLISFPKETFDKRK